MGNGCSKCCQCNEHKQYHGTLSSASSVYRRRSRGELPIASSDRLRITQTSTAVQLAVEHVQREDAGHYTLIARTKGNDLIRKDVELIVEDRSTGEDPPVFLRRLVDLSVKVGIRTRLLVEIRTSTDVKLTWYRNDRRICENDRINEVNEGNFHYLEVSPVILEDGGQWMVLAENSGGRNSCIAHLNVLVPKAYKAPEFIEELRAVLTQQGTVSLECKVIGVPTPQLRWFKDSKEIKAGDVFALTANLDDPTSLGTYTCEAVNCMGKSYSSSKVHVVGRGSREGSLKPADSIPNNAPPPIFTNELRDMSVRIGEPIILGCQVVVPPWPKTVVWYNKNGRIESGERYKLIEDGLGVYMIEIKPSESCDEGEWKCVVTSYEGCVGISTCNVTMDVPKNYRKPRFMESLRAVLTEEGLVSFECKVVGFPTPILKWFKDGQELKPGDVYQLTGTNSLGTYCCVAKNCMGESSSVAVLTVEDIQNQLNDEERLLFANQNQPPKFVVGLKSQEAKINESFQFKVNVKATPDPVLSWFRDELPVENSERYNHYRGEHENWHLDIRCVEFVDQAEWKCVAVNDFGTSVTSSYLKLQIPRHYKKPRFLECLRAVLTEEGAVNLECKVIGVPQPVLKWYKDGVELKPGDIHRIISGQDGTCCLGTYTCEARNCMGIVASSASLLGFEEAYKTQKEEKAQENELQRNFSLSTIQEEHTSQLYETPVGDITIDSKGEVSFSFDGKEVSVSLYETPDLTEEEALKIVEMYADQISEHVTEHNVVELPPLRFVKETSQSGKLLMEAVVIDISPEYFTQEEDMRTEAGLDDISITEITVHGSSGHEDEVDRETENYAQRSFEKMEEELSLTAPIRKRKKSRPTDTTEEFYSLSKASNSQAGDDDTSDLQTFASATQMSSRIDSAVGPDAAQTEENIQPPKRKKGKKQTDSDSSKTNEDDARMQDISGAVGDGLITVKPVKVISSAEEIEENLRALLPLAKLLKTIEHHLTVVEKEVVEQAAMMMTAASAEQSIAIIRNIFDPIKQVQSKLRVYSGETSLDALFQTMEEDIRKLHTSLQVIEKCVEIDETGITLIQRTSVCIIDSVGDQLIKALGEVQSIAKCFESTSLRAHIDLTADDIKQGLEITQGTIKSQALLQEAQELEAAKHLSETVAKLQVMPEIEPVSFATISDAKLPNEADALKVICLPVVNLQAALEKVENELSLEENEEQIYRKVHKKVLENIVEPIKELQSVLETIERKAELSGTQSTEQKVNNAILDIVTPALFELNKGLEVILSQSSDNVQAGMLTVSTVESMVPPLQEIQNGLAQLTQDVERGHFNEEAALDSADTQKLLQTIAQSVLHFETNIERLSTRLSPNVQKGLFSLKEEMSSLIGNVLDDNITKYHVTLLENLKRPIDELNYCIRQIESKSISGSLTDFIDPLHSLSDRVNLGKEIMHMSGAKQNEKNVDVLERMQQLIRNVEIDIEEHEFKMLQHEVELDEKHAADQEKSFIYMREAMEMKIAQDEAAQNIQELLHTLTEIEATPGLDTQTQEVLSQLDQSLTGLVADVEVLKESKSTREENEAATRVLTDIAKPLQTVAEVLRSTLTPEKVPKIHLVPQSESLSAVLQKIKGVVENIPDLTEHHIKLKALPIVQSVLEMVPVLQSITNLPQAITAVTQSAVGEKKKAEPDVDGSAAKKPKLDRKTEIDKDKIKTAPPKVEPVAKVEDEGSTLEDISAMKSLAESLPADSENFAVGDGTDHLKAFEANKSKVNTLLSQLKTSIESVLGHIAIVDVPSLQLESAQKVKACLSKLEDVNECIADVRQPIIVETVHIHSDISDHKTFADAVCHLETCVVQVEECLAQHDLKDLSENSVSDLKKLALPLQDLKECIQIFHNEELEQVISLPPASLSLTSAQVLQDIRPFVLSIKESNALETLQSLASDESLAQLQQFIQPIQELEKAVLSTIDQVHLSQIEGLPSEVSIVVLEKCAKPIWDIREALLHVQAETPQSPIEECPALQAIRQKADVIYNLLQYCGHANLIALENIADMSTQADVSALKSCAELKSVETGLQPVAKVVEESVKYLDIKECIAGGIKQIQVCLTSNDTNKEPELQNVGKVMKELKNELESMQNELYKSTTQQNTVEVNQRVAKTMFKLKECLVHTYETDVGKSLDEIEKTFEDILQALPALEIHLAQEMFTKIDTSLCAFKTTLLCPDVKTDLQKLVDPIDNILKSVKSINDLKTIDIEKCSLVVGNLQTHLMAAFRELNEVSDSLDGEERETALRAQDAVLATHEFIVDAREQLRTIELLQVIDSLTPNLISIYDSIALAKEQKNKQELLEALTQRVSSGKAFLQNIEEGLNANHPLYFKLAEENELDIRNVEAALIRIENEIIPKLELQIPTAEDNGLVDVLGVHLKSLQDSFDKLNTLRIISQDIHGDEKQNIELEMSLTSKILSEEEKLYAELQQRETSSPAEEDVSTLEDVSAIESLLGSPLRSHDEHIRLSSADVGKVDVLLSQLKSRIVSVLKYGSEVQVDFQQLESTEQVKASLLKLEKIHECFADVGHPSVIEPPLLSLSEAINYKTFADAVCNLEACVVQVKECIAQSCLQDLSETEMSELKTLEQNLHDVRECIEVFQNEELEQVLSLPTISMSLNSAQVLQDIQPFVLSIKENHALETLQSLAEDESLAQLKQFIQPIQELQNLALSDVEQVHLSQAESISQKENVEILKRFAKPVLDLREALLHIQEETPLSALEECLPLKVVKEKIDIVYHLLQYCEQVDMSIVENIVDMSTQADISAIKSCIEPKSSEANLELTAVVAQENVKFPDVKENLSNIIKQLEACATDVKGVNVPELREVFAVVMELRNELEIMQTELSKAFEQQHIAESQAKVAKVMFKLKKCLAHTYEAGVDQSLEHIETAFADLLQIMPILEIRLAQEMCFKMESATLEFSSMCTKSESLVELHKLIEPLKLVLNNTKAINELQLIEVEKSTMIVANLQSHLMTVFRALDEINETIESGKRKNIIKLQNAVISISNFIDTSEKRVRVIELIQELDSLVPQLNSVLTEINAEESNKGKQAFLEALTLSLTSGKAFIVRIEEGLKSKNPLFVRLSTENSLDIQRVREALVRVETEILPKMHSENPSAEEGALVDTLRLHLKNLQAKLVVKNNGTISSPSEVKETLEPIDGEKKEPAINGLESELKQSEAVILKQNQTELLKAKEKPVPTEDEQEAISHETIKIGEKESIKTAELASISMEQASQETETATATISKKNDQSDSGEPCLPTEIYLQKTEELIGFTTELIRNLNKQQLSKATIEVFKSVEITLSEMKNLIQIHPSSAIEDHIFLPLFKLKDLIAFIYRSPMEDISKSMEMRQIIQNSNNVLLEVLNGHQGLRSAMILDITEATLPYIGSIISFIAQIFPNDKELSATSSALERISSEFAVIKNQNAPNMNISSRSYQSLKSAIFDLRNSFESICTKTQNSPLLEQKEDLDRLCKAIDEGLITDVLEILQELEVKKDLFVLLLEGLKYISQESTPSTVADFRKDDEPKRDEDSVVYKIKNVLAVIDENESWKDNEDEIKEAIQNPTDERFSKLLFKMREHIVHTYEGAPLSSNETNYKLEEIIDKLFASNPEATRKLTEEYFANIKANKKHISENITKIEDIEFQKKVSTLNLYLGSIIITIEEIMTLKSKSKLGKKLDALKKSVMDTVIFLDELHKVQSADKKLSIEKAKNIALSEFDYINNKQEAAQLPKILLDTNLLTNNLLELCIKLQTAHNIPSKQKEERRLVEKIEDVEVQEAFTKLDKNEKILQDPFEVESVKPEVVSIGLEAETPQTERTFKEPEATKTPESVKPKAVVEAKAPELVISEELTPQKKVASKEPEATELTETPESIKTKAEVEAEAPTAVVSEQPTPTIMQAEVHQQEVFSKEPEATEITETSKTVKSETEVVAEVPAPVVSKEPTSTIMQAEVPQQEVFSKGPEITEMAETQKSVKPEAEVEAKASIAIISEEPTPTVMQVEEPQQELSSKEPETSKLIETVKYVKPEAEVGTKAPLQVVSEELTSTIIQAEVPKQEVVSKELEAAEVTVTSDSVKPEAEEKVRVPAFVISEESSSTVLQGEVRFQIASKEPEMTELTETPESVKSEVAVKADVENRMETASTLVDVKISVDEKTIEEKPIKDTTEAKVDKDAFQQVMAEQDVSVREEPLNPNLSSYYANMVENLYIIRQLFQGETHAVLLKKIPQINKELETIIAISEAIKVVNNVEKSSEKMVIFQKVLMNLFVTFDDLQQQIIGELKSKLEEVKSLALSEYETIEKSTGTLSSENVLISISNLIKLLINVCQEMVKEGDAKHTIEDVIETKIAEEVTHEKLSNEKQEEANIDFKKAVLEELENKELTSEESIEKMKEDCTEVTLETEPSQAAGKITAMYNKEPEKKCEVEVTEVQKVQKEIVAEIVFTTTTSTDQHEPTEPTLSEELSKNLQKYFENIVSNVDNFSFKIATPQLQKSLSKMNPVIPTLRTFVLVAKYLKNVQSLEKSAERIVSLQKSLMDTFVIFDDLHEIATKELKPNLEAVKTTALLLYDNIENSTKYVESERVLLLLNKLSSSILEVANVLQVELQQNKENVTENILEIVRGTKIQIDLEEFTESTLSDKKPDEKIAVDEQRQTKLSVEGKKTEKNPEEQAEKEVCTTLGIEETDNENTTELLPKQLPKSEIGKSLDEIVLAKVVSQQKPVEEKSQEKHAEVKSEDEIRKLNLEEQESEQPKVAIRNEKDNKAVEDKKLESNLEKQSIIGICTNKPQDIKLDEKIAVEEGDMKLVIEDAQNNVYSKLEELYNNIIQNIMSLEEQTKAATHPLLSRKLTSLKTNIGNVSETIKNIEQVEKASKDIVTLQNILMDIFVTFDDLHYINDKDTKCKIEEVKINALAVYDFIENSQNHINSENILQKTSDLVAKILKTCSELRKATEGESIEGSEVSPTKGLIIAREPEPVVEIVTVIIAENKSKEESTKPSKTETEVPVNLDSLQYFNQIVEYVENTSIKVNSINDYDFRSKLSSSNLTLVSIVSCMEYIKNTNTIQKSKEKVVTLQKNLMDIFIFYDDLQAVTDKSFSKDFENIKDLSLSEHNAIDKCVDVIDTQKILKDTVRLCEGVHSICEKIAQYVNASNVMKRVPENDGNKKLEGPSKDTDSIQEITDKNEEEEKTETIVDDTKIKPFEKPTEKLFEEILKKEREPNIKRKTSSARKEKILEEFKEKENSLEEIKQSEDKPKKESGGEITDEKLRDEMKKIDDKSDVIKIKQDPAEIHHKKAFEEIEELEETQSKNVEKRFVDLKGGKLEPIDISIEKLSEEVKKIEEKPTEESRRRGDKNAKSLHVVSDKLESTKRSTEKPIDQIKQAEEKIKEKQKKVVVDADKKDVSRASEELKVFDEKLNTFEECIEKPIEGTKYAEEKLKKEKEKANLNKPNDDEKDFEELKDAETNLELMEKLEKTTKKIKETEEKLKKENKKKSGNEDHKNDEKKAASPKIAEKELEFGKKPVEKTPQEIKQTEEKLREENNKSKEQIFSELKVADKTPQSAETPTEKPLVEKPKDNGKKNVAANEKNKDKDDEEQKEALEKPSSNLTEKLNEMKDKPEKDRRKKSADEGKNVEEKPNDKTIMKDRDDEKYRKQKSKDPKFVDKRQESVEIKKEEEIQKIEKRKKSVGEEKKADDKMSEDLIVDNENPVLLEQVIEMSSEKTKDVKKKDINELTVEKVQKSEQLSVVDSKLETGDKTAEKDNKQIDEKSNKQRRKKSSDDEKRDHDKKLEELHIVEQKVDNKKSEKVKIDNEKQVPLEQTQEEKVKDEKKQDGVEMTAGGEQNFEIHKIIDNKSETVEKTFKKNNKQMDEKPKKQKKRKSPGDEKKDDDKKSKELNVVAKESESSEGSAEKLFEEIQNIDEQLDKEKANKTPLIKSTEEMNQKNAKPKINEKSDEVKKFEDNVVVKTHPESVVKTLGVPNMTTSPTADRRLRKDVSDAGIKQPDQSKTHVDNSRQAEYKDKRESRSARRAPNVDLKLTNRNSPVGSDIKLTCSISGAELKIDWYRDKTFVENGNKYRKTFNDGLSCLEIKAVDAGDAGVYRCVATNRNGEVETSCLVTVYDVPTTKFGTTPIFTRNIRDSYHKDQNEITLECKVSGNPKPQIFWQKDNTLLPLDSNKYKYVELGDGVIQLFITEPVKTDTGLYTCYAENDSGQMKISKFLDISDYVQKLTQKRTLQKVVQEQEPTAATHQNEGEASEQLKSKVKDEKLKLTAETTMKPMSIAEGNKVQLIFYVSGYIEDVYWLRGKERVTKDTRHKIYNINGAISLEIHNARTDDTGSYKCVVRNNKNTIESCCDLTVYEQTAGKLPSSFADNIKEYYNANRNEITLTCQVHGRPNVTWLRDDHTISNNRYKSTEEVGGIRKLIIRNPIPSDCGIFACFAETNDHIHAISKSIRTGDLKQLMTANVEITTNGEYVPHMRRSSQTLYEMMSNGEASSHFTTEEVIKRTRELRPLGMISHSKPLFSTLLHDRTVAEGSSIRLSCNVVCDGDTRIEWLKNHRPLPNDGQYLTVLRNGIASLDIAATSIEDSGNYTCHAINDYGETFTHAQLRVYKHYEDAVQPSAFVQSIRDTYSINENTLVLDCRVRGKPRPDIQWMKGSDMLNEDDRYNIINSADGYTKLTINNPTEKDSGLYACVARNEAAENKITHQVDFVGRERFALEKTHGYFHRDPNKPHFVVPLSNQTVSPGGTVAISAEFMKSSTPLEVQWLRNRQTVAGQPGIKTFMEGGVYTLAIPNAQPEVEGTYTCRASNAFGRIESHVSVDIAAGAPKNERPPLFLSRPESEMKILVGDPFSISFRIAGEPKPKLTFLKGTKDITKSDRVSKEVSDDYTRFTVQSSQIADSGTYFVVARNNFGTDRVYVTVAVKAPKRKESST